MFLQIVRATCLVLLTTLSPVSLGQSTDTDSVDIDTLSSDITTAREQGDMERADALAATFLEMAKSSSSNKAIALATYQQARNAMERNNYPEAQSLLQSSISIYQDINDSVGLAEAYRQMGLTYRYQSNYSIALEYIYQALQLFQQDGDKNNMASIQNSIGIVLEKLGEYEEATAAHQQALELNREIGDQEGIASALFNLGDLRRVMGDYEEAFTYYQDALVLDEKSGIQKNIAYSHNKLGFILTLMGEFDTARVHLTKALDIFTQIQAPRDADWARSSLAQLELEMGNLTQAKSLIEGVIERARENNFNSLLVDALKVAAKIAYLERDYDLAIEYIEQGLAQAKENNERPDESIFEALRVDVLSVQESWKQAFDALQRQKTLDDQILDSQRANAIAKVQAQSEFVRQSLQIELLEKEKAIQNVRLEQRELYRNLWIFATMAAGIVVFLLYGRSIQRKINVSLEEMVALRTRELERKNRELENAYAEMEAISITDKLTGIRNRRFLENQIDADLEQSLRQFQDWRSGKAEKPIQSDIVVFVIDMDNFKSVNDLYGHNAGDKVLIQLADRMAKVFRHSDYLIRWGGEEFIAVARFIDRHDAGELAQRLVDAVHDVPFDIADDKSIQQSCSIGYACHPLVPTDPQSDGLPTILAMADACLYMAKHSGKNTWLGVDSVSDRQHVTTEITPSGLRALAGTKKATLRRPL